MGGVVCRRRRPPGPQCIHRAHRNPPTPSHAQPKTRITRSLHTNTAGSPAPTHHMSPVLSPPVGPPHHGGNRHMEPPTTPAAAPRACHSNEPQMQGGRPHSRPAHRCGPEPTGEATILDQVGTTPRLVRVRPTKIRAPQQAVTHQFIFLQHPNWPNKLVLENHAASGSRHSWSPKTHRWRNPWSIQSALEHSQTALTTEIQAHHRPPE